MKKLLALKAISSAKAISIYIHPKTEVSIISGTIWTGMSMNIKVSGRGKPDTFIKMENVPEVLLKHSDP